ncbi:MAG: hypothetical protein V3S49_05605 [Thermodesulfobacteriota bacterium]
MRIPLDTIKDFVDQILSQSPCMIDFDTVISNAGGWININIFSSFKQVVPIRQEVDRMRVILKQEIERVFGFTHFKINFQMKNINIDQSRNSFSSEFAKEEQVENETVSLEHVLTPEKGKESENENMIEEVIQKESPHKLMPWE